MSEEIEKSIRKIVKEIRKNAKEEVFEALEEEFNTEQICGCPEWCDCYKKLKERILK